MTDTSTDRRIGAVIVLAAGGGTRMKSSRSKLLHEVAGHSMLSYALAAAASLEPEHVCVVVGHQREQVLAHLEEIAPGIETAVQDQQNGTGHAVQCALAELGEIDGDVLVTYGDVPMLTGETLAGLVASHRSQQAQVSVLTAVVDNPFGYGRIVRDERDQVAKIVEQKDASDAERAIREINSGIYLFDGATLRDGLARIKSDNAQGELYLTDVVGIAHSDGKKVVAHVTEDVWQTEGVNDRVQLARMNREVNRRTVEKWMRAGVTVLDPETTWIQPTVELAQDVTLLPGVSLEGATTIAAGATVGPDTTLRDCEVGEDAEIVRSHCVLAIIGKGVKMGPYVYLRPGAELQEGSHAGTFVEIKNTIVGPGAKVPHLCYAGDAVIDEGANIGAGTIFANYDGTNKSKTHVGKHSFVGSNSVLVAPVDIADGAYVAAGSAVTDDVASGQLAVARGKQHNSEGWVAKRRGGTKTAAAAESAGEPGVHPAVQESRDKLAAKAAAAQQDQK